MKKPSFRYTYSNEPLARPTKYSFQILYSDITSGFPQSILPHETIKHLLKLCPNFASDCSQFWLYLWEAKLKMSFHIGIRHYWNNILLWIMILVQKFWMGEIFFRMNVQIEFYLWLLKYALQQISNSVSCNG